MKEAFLHGFWNSIICPTILWKKKNNNIASPVSKLFVKHICQAYLSSVICQGQKYTQQTCTLHINSTSVHSAIHRDTLWYDNGIMVWRFLQPLVCVWAEVRGCLEDIFLSHAPPYLFRQGPSLNQELPLSARQTGHWPSRSVGLSC